MLNRFIPGDDTKTPTPDGVDGWDYWQDRYGYNLPNQFMNDLTSRFYWDQDSQSWKAIPGQTGSGIGLPVARVAAKVPNVGAGAGNVVGPSGATVAGSGSSVGAGAAGGGGVGGGTMAWAPSAIQAGGQIGGAAIGGKGAKEAARIQAQSSREALQFAREQEAAAQGRYGQSKEQYDKQVSDWYAARNALLGRYGVDISLGAGGAPPGGFPPQPNTFAPQGDGARNVAPPGGGPSPVRHPRPSGPPQGSTLGDMAVADTDWNDWGRYNLGVNRNG